MYGDDVMDAIAALALGVLAPDEARKVRLQIALDDRLLEEYAAMRATADLVGYAAEAFPPTLEATQCDRMKTRLLNAIRSERPELRAVAPSRRAVAWPAWAAIAAALVLALVSTLGNVSLRSDLTAARERIASLESRVTAETRRANDEQGQLADLYARDGKHYPVSGGEIVKRAGRIYIAMRDLPKLPKGKVFQAWTLAPGEKTVAPSVTFTPDQSGSVVVALPPQTKAVAAVAVSVEPEGGSKAPTTKPLFVRPLS
jgi:anti-sigma-K factor RskA